MQTLLAILFALCAAATAGTATDFDPFAGPKPVAVFIRTNPWLMAVGSDTPCVAIYENGDVIFQKTTDDEVTYRRITLDRNELKSVRERFAPLLAETELKPKYDLRPGASDLPEAKFYVRDGEREVATSVYGLLSGGAKLASRPGFKAAKVSPPPDALFSLHAWLDTFDYPGSTPWTPQYVEVMLWDYAYAPDASILWPSDWPSLSSDRTIKRRSAYSIYLDGSLLPKLDEFLSTRKEKGAVEIEGRKMSATYRFAFPQEPVWLRAFARANGADDRRGGTDVE